MKIKRNLKPVLSIILALSVFFSGIPMIMGSLEVDAAATYWKDLKAEPYTYTMNIISWKKLSAKQRKKISGIAVYRGTTPDNMKLLKRIKKTSKKHVDTKAKAGKEYYYTLKTYTKKASSYKYKNQSSVMMVVTKTEPAYIDTDFEVQLSDGEYDIHYEDCVSVEAKSSGEMTWSSSDTSVAEPSSKVTRGSNTIWFKDPGKAIITVTNYDGQTKSATFTILGQAVTQLNDNLSYSYKLKVFCQPYTSNSNYFFLETDNPSNILWDRNWRRDINSPRKDGDYIDIEVLDSNGKDVSCYTTNDRGYPVGHNAIHLSPGGLFDDIQYTRWYINEYNSLQGEIPGGYLGTFTPPSSGEYTIRIREYNVNGYDITATKPKTLGKINVLDSSKEYTAWMQQVIDENTDASMTKPEKMQAICEYIVKTGHYPDCLSNEALDEYEERYGKSHGMAYINSILGRDNNPAFVCRCWDSYTSTYLLEDFGEMIEYPVRSLYWDYQPGTSEWASNHYLVESVDDGSIYMACPVDKEEYSLEEIEMIDPITYQGYWRVLE